MSIQLNIQWLQVEELRWLWSDSMELSTGTLDDLLDQKQQRNLEQVNVRLFLPSHWFTCFEVNVPKGAKRVRQELLNFAAEEFVADDIEEVLLSQLSKIEAGKIALQAQNKAQIVDIIHTLRARGLQTIEAYNSGWFRFINDMASDLSIVVSEPYCYVRRGWQLHDIHIQGFTIWLEHWLASDPVSDDSTIAVFSSTSDSIARNIVTALESSGRAIDWTVQAEPMLVDWVEWFESNKAWGNIASSLTAPKKHNHYAKMWLPSAIAASILLFVWGTTSLVSAQRLNQQAELTWQASESVFRQVFGAEKRIQRPLMLREMRSEVANRANPDADETQLSTLQVLSDLTVAQSSLTLEELRVVRNRQEAIFTVTQPLGTNDDSFASFESLKNDLINKGYSVQYSASQTTSDTRAQYRATLQGAN